MPLSAVAPKYVGHPLRLTSFASQALHGDFSLGLVHSTIILHYSWQLKAVSSSVGRGSVSCRCEEKISHLCKEKSLKTCAVALAKTEWEVKGHGGTWKFLTSDLIVKSGPNLLLISCEIRDKMIILNGLIVDISDIEIKIHSDSDSISKTCKISKY